MITVTLTQPEYDKLRKCRKCRVALMRKYYKPNTPIQVSVNGKIVLIFPKDQVEENYSKHGKLK